MSEEAEAAAVDREALWRAVVFEAGCWALDRMSCEDDDWSEAPTEERTVDSAAARIGAWFVFGLWAHLVWRRERARRETGGGPPRYYGPGSFGEVVCGPGGTAAEAEEVRTAAWRDAVELGFAELFAGARKNRSPARQGGSFE
jgi:hypothetical protein